MLPVPSFSSFPELTPPPNSHPTVAPSRGEKRRKRDKRDKRHKSPSIPNDSTTKHRVHRADADLDLHRDSASRLFFSDRKGDPLNVQYGGLNTREVPKYYGGRFILGLPSVFSVTRSSHGIEVGLPGRRKMPSLTDASSRALLSRGPVRSFVNAVASSSKYEEHDGFLRLPSRSVKEQDYRSIENTNANSDSGSDSEESAMGESSGEESPNSYQATLKSINERLAVDPHSIFDWLLLLSHTLLTIPTASKNSTRARSEISISILSRALAANGNSPTLRAKYLQAGEEIWHESKLRAEWEEALKKVQGAEIWMSWFEWRIRTGNKGISDLVKDAKRALTALHHDEVGQVKIFWRIAVAFQNAGFTERATAMFQAQTELTFQLPPLLLEHSFPRRLDSLEEFWESECPRLGEPGSQGWGSWISSGRPSAASPSSQPKLADVKDFDPFRKFGFSESIADRVLFLPRRSTDMDADSDPYATILFSEIRDVLLHLESRRAKDMLRFAWLTVIGLNLPGFPGTDNLEAHSLVDLHDKWFHAYLNRPAFLDALFPAKVSTSRITNDAVAGTTIGRVREYTNGLGCPILSWAWGAIRPLEVPSSDGRTKSLWNKKDLEGVDVAFVGNVFRQLRLGNDDLEWDLYALAFAGASSLKSALKLSRSFLATAPESLFHWAAHGRLEQLRGRSDDARKVYETVLTSNPGPIRPGAGQLWYDWAEMEWLSGRVDAALKIILSCVGVESSGGVALLRSKRNLDNNLNAVDGQARQPWVKLRALLELLAGAGPEHAVQVFENQLSLQQAGSTEHESLILANLLMLYRYSAVLGNPMPPALLRERVERAVKLYPSNPVLLGLFLEGQRGQGMWGKVRAMLGEGSGVEKGVLRRLEETWIAGWDKGRWEAELERTRSGLAAAMESERYVCMDLTFCEFNHDPRTRQSPALWRVFIEFEIRAGQLDRAKKLLFRAISDCPLVKGRQVQSKQIGRLKQTIELYLVAFGPLRAVFSAQELNGFADTMAERELRLRHGLEEFMEGWEGNNESGAESEGGSGDEIVTAAEEYRKRLPY
ncbi:NRDE-2, necessary for RNA interference-domain-containing protein [Mycena pura]|uniref:NRDE-2, necessary for RNA interference-domain-containing protein n=1 Tax=Mycena pura TaxID=153505 RepID=A0AAD6YPK4_9AGAR|nr:NRDE-2, necessary for RNA interference-domain-containing protein [Mycena pura]